MAELREAAGYSHSGTGLVHYCGSFEANYQNITKEIKVGWSNFLNLLCNMWTNNWSAMPQFAVI